MLATIVLLVLQQQSEAVPTDLTKSERFVWFLHRDDFAAFEKAAKELGPNPKELINDHYTPLSYAAWAGELRHVEFLLKLGAQIDGRNSDGSTALMVAARERFDLDGVNPIILRLIVDGADVNAKDTKGASPLHYASSWPIIDFSWEGQEDAYARTLSCLVANKAIIEAKDNDGMTPLLYAVKSGHKESFDALVKLGADPRAVDRLGRTAYTFVAESEGIGPFKQAILDLKLPRSPIDLVLAGEIDEALAMLKGGTERLSYGAHRESPLAIAAATGRLELVKAVLKYPIALNEADGFGETAFHKAIGLTTSYGLLAPRKLTEGDHLGIIAALHDAGADPNKAIPLEKARMDEEDETPLYRAVGVGQIEIVKAMLEAGAKVDGFGSKRPLALACTLRRIDIAKLLLERGADAKLGFPVRELFEGYAKLWPGASDGSRSEILALLLANGAALEFPATYANPNDPKYRVHAMHIMVNDVECLRLVLSTTKVVDPRSGFGLTPLMLAARAGSLEGVEFLLSQGASKMAVDDRGRTALDHAMDSGSAAIIERLRG